MASSDIGGRRTPAERRARSAVFAAPRLSADRALLWIALALLALLILWPLGLVARLALFTEAGFTLQPLIDAFGTRSVPRGLWNSLESSLVSALLATALGGALALVIGLTDVRTKSVLVFFVLLPMMIPPHVTAIAWLQTLGPGSPLLAPLGLAPAPGVSNPLYSRGGVILLLALQHTPLAFLVIRAGLRSLPREVSEAARVSGARPFAMLRRVVLPLIGSAAAAGFALAFVAGLGNFGIPALLGTSAGYVTLPVLMWRRLSSFGPSALDDMAVIAVILLLVATAAVLLQRRLERGGAYALVGPPQQPLRIALGRWRLWVESALWALVAVTFLLPMASLVATALVPTYGVRLTAETLTLANFREVLFEQSVTARAFLNSTLAAGLAALCLAAAAIVIGRAASGSAGVSGRAARGMVGVAEVAYATPGVVISVAFILTFIRPIPILEISLYGSLLVIGLAYGAAFASVALRPVAAAYATLDPNLDAAARVAGAGALRRLTRIAAPLVAPAAASGALLVFLTAYNEITVSALLWSSGAETIGTVIFNYEDGGFTVLAAAMAAITVAVTAALMLLLDRLGRRAGPGVVPWRD